MTTGLGKLKEIVVLVALCFNLSSCASTSDKISSNQDKQQLYESKFGLDLGGYFFCQLNSNKTSCHENGCIWDDKGTCLSSHTSECPSTSAAKSCDNMGCRWTNHGCLRSEFLLNCYEYASQKSCVSSGCLWDLKGKNCLSRASSFCSETKDVKTCRELGCVYSRSTDECLSKGFDSCSSVKDASSCYEIGRKWLSDRNICLAPDTTKPIQLRKCQSYTQETDCWEGGVQMPTEVTSITHFLGSISLRMQ